MKANQPRHSVIGFFSELDPLLSAIRMARERGHKDLCTISPVPLHGVDEALGARRSPVRRYTLAGGLFGLLVGWALTIGSVEHYPLIVGGKPLISLTPFGVIAYICTILFGALATVAGMLIHAQLPRVRAGRGYDPRLTGNRFGLQVLCDENRVAEVEKQLFDAGAEDVKYVAL